MIVFKHRASAKSTPAWRDLRLVTIRRHMSNIVCTGAQAATMGPTYNRGRATPTNEKPRTGLTLDNPTPRGQALRGDANCTLFAYPFSRQPCCAQLVTGRNSGERGAPPKCCRGRRSDWRSMRSGRSEIARFRRRRADDFVHHVRQAVGAKQIDVVGRSGTRRCRRHDGLDAQRAVTRFLLSE